MTRDLSEAEWECLAMDTLGELAWLPMEGKQIAPGSGERESWDDLILPTRLGDAIAQLNPQLPLSAVDEAVKKVASPPPGDALPLNFEMHRYLTEGIRSVVYTDEFGAEHNPTIRLIDTRDPYANDFLAVSQVTVVQGEHRRRLDIVLYVNGMPLGVIELKKAGDEKSDLAGAHQQLMTYVQELPQAFRCNVVCVVTDGITARYGTAFTPYNHYAPWSVDDDGQPVEQPTDAKDLAINLLLHGLLQQHRFIEILGGYIAFARDRDGKLLKRIAKPHQYFAVSTAVEKTIEAVRGDGLAGVVWHTQGSGKSFEMELYANQIGIHPSLGNPTLVVLTDRTDLDDQLYGAFLASELLPEPLQAETRDALRAELSNRTVGGIIFSTLQKFGRTKAERDAGDKHPLLSDRRNIIVMVDEAHRSHYDQLDGYAWHLRNALPGATMIAFTGTPISEADRNTREVFGDYIDKYTFRRAVDDKATVPVYYESRLIPVELDRNVDPAEIDERADEVTTGLDESERERIQRAVAAMNAVYGAPDRVRKLAEDVVEHWETRSQQMLKYIGSPGKAMIVCATRDICAALYKQIIAIKPDWHSEDITRGAIKVVYTGNPSDPDEIRKHVRRPSDNKRIQKRARGADDELQLVIVQSMWLTGFDSPPLHTMYLDKPMRGAALMQALARVNRTYRGKQDGLLVGYAPITDSLHAALAEYLDDSADQPVEHDLSEAVAKLQDLHEVICAMLKVYDWRKVLAGTSKSRFINAVLGAVETLRNPGTPGNQAGKDELTLSERFRLASTQLARLYALCASSGQVNEYGDDIRFFEAVRIWMAKFDAEDRAARGLPVPADVELYLRQLTAGAIEAGGVKNIYEAAGLPNQDLSQLDDAFITRMQQARNPHLTIEALRRLIAQEMRKTTKHNIVRQQSFSDRLLKLMRQYTNKHLTTAEIIAELIALAQQVSEDADRGTQFSPPLNNDELAFYDAVAQNQSAIAHMGEGVLADIARDLVQSLKNNVTVDWVSRDDVRAKLRTTIKRLLVMHGYPPDMQQSATDLVIRQMETFADVWSPQTGQ